MAGVTCVADISGLGFKHIRSLGLEQIRCMAAFLTGSFPLWFRRIHIVHHPRFGLVAEDPRGLLSKVWFGNGETPWLNIQGLVWYRRIHVVHHPRFGFVSGGSTLVIVQGLVWFQRINVVHHPRFGLMWEDLRGSLSKVWFGVRGSMCGFGLKIQVWFDDLRGSLSQVWFGSGGTPWLNIQGSVWYWRIYVVHHPRFGLVAVDPHGSLSKVWFGFR